MKSNESRTHQMTWTYRPTGRIDKPANKHVKAVKKGDRQSGTRQFHYDMLRFASYLVLLIVLHEAASEFCYWDGTPPRCKGRCPPGLRETFRDTYGDGGTCWAGTKARCCLTTIPGASCHWAGTSPFCIPSCPAGYNEVTRDRSGDGRNCLTGEKVLCCNAGNLGILG